MKKNQLKSMTMWGFLILAIQYFAGLAGYELPEGTVTGVLDKALPAMGLAWVYWGRFRKGDLKIWG